PHVSTTPKRRVHTQQRRARSDQSHIGGYRNRLSLPSVCGAVTAISNASQLTQAPRKGKAQQKSCAIAAVCHPHSPPRKQREHVPLIGMPLRTEDRSRRSVRVSTILLHAAEPPPGSQGSFSTKLLI